MNFRTLNIAPRSLVCFGFFAVLVTGLGLFSLIQTSSLKAGYEIVETGVLPTVKSVGELRSDLISIRFYNSKLTRAQDESDRGIASTGTDKAKQSLEETRHNLQAHADKLESLLDSERSQRIKAELHQGTISYLAVHSRYLNAVEQHDAAAIKDLTRPEGELTLSANSLSKVIDAASAMADQIVQDTHAHANDTYQSTRNFTLLAIGVALVATLLLAALFTRSLTVPLALALSVAERIARNDFSQPVSENGHDEPGRLLAALARMQVNLRDTLRDLGAASNQLASTSEEMTSVTEDAQRAASRQNLEIDQAATAMNQMSAAVEEVARYAAQASDTAQHSKETADNGLQRVEETIGVIGELHQAVGVTSSEIDKLAVQVKGISGVLDVIRSVADQTNLLALNAAIEAARAGDAGRGFAVVAEEVRALAQRTQQSTAEIEHIVASVQTSAEEAVKAMGYSSEHARASLDVAEKAGDSLREIATAILNINEQNLSIASATEEQAQVAREVDSNLVSIRDQASQAAVGANQTSAASGELSQLAVALNQMVQQFKI